MKNRQAFTLIELLVVVLIIGILAAVALPQYQKAVEKSRMTEAIMNVRKIIEAQQLYYMANGEWANANEIDLLDFEIPGSISRIGSNRIQTKYFVYSPGGTVGKYVALAYRRTGAETEIEDTPYRLYVVKTDPTRIHCGNIHSNIATAIQKKLCQELDAKGSL